MKKEKFEAFISKNNVSNDVKFGINKKMQSFLTAFFYFINLLFCLVSFYLFHLLISINLKTF